MPTDFEIFTFIAGLMFTVLILAVGHWFPWQLTRIQAYSYGTVAILVGFAIWRGLLGDWHTPLGLLIIASAGGIVVKLAYSADHVIRRVKLADMLEQVDDARKE